MEFIVEVDKKLYEIRELVTAVSFTDKLNDGCSKLEFNYVNDDLIITNGSIVRFKYKGVNIFYGVVFKVGRSNETEINITAYDPLRYCKAKDTFASKGDTVGSLTKKMCNYYGLKWGLVADTKYKLPTSVYDGKTWLDIIYDAISDTLIGTGKKYALRSEIGGIAVRDLEELKLNLVLGDESLAYGYEYTKSIDDGFYNLIKIQDKKNEQFIESEDRSSINKYGMLQYFEVANEKMNKSQIKAMADSLLKLYNRELETMSLECLGDTSIRAGNSFYAIISEIDLEKRLIVKSVTHEYLPLHTMSLEVMI